MSNARRANNALRRGFRVGDQLLHHSHLPEPDQAEIGRTCHPRSSERQSDTPGLHTWDAVSDRGGSSQRFAAWGRLFALSSLNSHSFFFQAPYRGPQPASNCFFDLVLIAAAVKGIQRFTGSGYVERPSELVAPFAIAIAREYESKVYAMHVLTPVPLACATPESAAAAIEGLEEGAQAGMQRVDTQLAGVPHETMLVRAESVWSSVEQVLGECEIDLVILGTHGRTGAIKLLLGSVAEEIFRRAKSTVLTIGPKVQKGAHNGGQFHRVLFATDFTPEAQAATPYAISMAQEHQARLLLLHVMRYPDFKSRKRTAEDSVANAMHQLYELVPPEAELWCRPEATVRFGNPAERILKAAMELEADLIVLGVRDAAGHLGAATHLQRTTAHKVVAHAPCPVLTVRG